MTNRTPLAGIKVVDFSRVLAGPHCTRALSDLGADVIKIEPPRGDISRYALPGDETASMSYYYIQQNVGKRNISIDLNFPEGREVVRKMCDSADIIVENFRAGTLKFFGLDYESVAARNPKVIYASISGYGQGSALSHRSAYAPTVHAESGFVGGMIDHLGEDLTVKRHDAYSHADIYTGLEAIIGILAALHHRDQTGEGQYVDIAMAATMLAVNERVHADLSGVDLGAEPAALGPADSPFFKTSYGDVITIATSVVSSLTFPNYIAAMRRPDLAFRSQIRHAGGAPEESQRPLPDHPAVDSFLCHGRRTRCTARRSEAGVRRGSLGQGLRRFGLGQMVGRDRRGYRPPRQGGQDPRQALALLEDAAGRCARSRLSR
ncbi:crotonobetainyl-CoA:carnitine CoA-transferase CaiB-like acyl-CoA transferase [Bradyrhizobium sp. LM3.6]